MVSLQIFNNNSSGQLLIEALVGFGIAAIVLPALFLGFFATKQGKAEQGQRIQAVALMKEAEEVVRSVREEGWGSFSTDGIYHPQISGSAWSLAAGPETISGLTRTITIGDVYRDNNGNIVQSGGTLDPSTKRVDINVSWSQPYSSSVTSTLYLTRYLGDTNYTQTTATDFNLGSLSNTKITNTNGGEVVLGVGGGGGNWCNPIQSITTVDLSRQGVPTAISAYVGNIVTGTGLNSSGPTFVKIGVSGNNPPTATILGQVNNSKANGVFTEGNYGYIATTNHSQEIQIIDLTKYTDPPTNSTFQQIGYFDAPGNTQGNSIYVSNNTGYMTAGNYFYIFDLSSRTGSRPQLNTSNVVLSGTGNKTVVVNGYAFIATSSDSQQLQIVDVSNPANPAIVAYANLGDEQSAKDLVVNSTGTRAYVVTGYQNGIPDFYIVDTTNKSGSLPIIGSGYNTQGMNPKGVDIAVGNKAIIVGSGGSKQYQVIDITNELSPVYCGGLPITNGAYDVASVLQPDGYAYSYVVTGDTNAELKMILGGTGNQYASSGTFTSSPFDALSKVAFNYFNPTFTTPSSTSLKFQVAVSNPSAGGNCSNATYNFVGPDGTSGTYFTGAGSIPLATSGGYTNPGECLEYKAYFSTTDFSVSPTLYDVTVNYSP